MARTVLCGLLALVGVLLLGIPMSNSQTPGSGAANPWSIPNPTAAGNENLLMYTGRVASGVNQVILVDSTKRVMAVYFVSAESGVIQLKSVRNLAADLQLEEFNGADPSPAKVRSILGQP